MTEDQDEQTETEDEKTETSPAISLEDVRNTLKGVLEDSNSETSGVFTKAMQGIMEQMTGVKQTAEETKSLLNQFYDWATTPEASSDIQNALDEVTDEQNNTSQDQTDNSDDESETTDTGDNSDNENAGQSEPKAGAFWGNWW